MNLPGRVCRPSLSGLVGVLILTACDSNNNNNNSGDNPPPEPMAKARKAADSDDLLQGPLARSSGTSLSVTVNISTPAWAGVDSVDFYVNNQPELTSDGVSSPMFPVVPEDLDPANNKTLEDLTDGNLDEKGLLAYVFTNPLFIDVGNNGWASPGVANASCSP